MIHRNDKLPITQQARLLSMSRSSLYYKSRSPSPGTLAVIHRIDRLHMEHPFAGSRMLPMMLHRAGHQVGRRHVATLMRRMGIEALYRKPRTTARHRGHKVYPYLLRNRWNPLIEPGSVVQITGTTSLWVMGPDVPFQLFSRNQLFHVLQKLFPAGLTALLVIFGF